MLQAAGGAAPVAQPDQEQGSGWPAGSEAWAVNVAKQAGWQVCPSPVTVMVGGWFTVGVGVGDGGVGVGVALVGGVGEGDGVGDGLGDGEGDALGPGVGPGGGS